jgi:BirA family biotin operon repressor/biotin-[acetyl-CoA-carboxylase] ligase
MTTFDPARVVAPVPVIYREEVRSTNDVAAMLGREGAAHLTTVIADRQTAGRGRLGRTWATFPGQSLALSVVVRDVDDSLPLVACLAVRDAVRALTGADLRVKWPNDLLWQGRKVCGVLTESFPTGQGNGRFYVLGIGLNVNTPANAPDGVVFSTLEQACGRPLEREAVLGAVLTQLEKSVQTLRHHGFATAYAHAYAAACDTLGQWVRWADGGRNVQGRAVSVSDRGGILVQTDEGLVECLAGDMIVVGAAHEVA